MLLLVANVGDLHEGYDYCSSRNRPLVPCAIEAQPPDHRSDNCAVTGQLTKGGGIVRTGQAIKTNLVQNLTLPNLFRGRRIRAHYLRSHCTPPRWLPSVSAGLLDAVKYIKGRLKAEFFTEHRSSGRHDRSRYTGGMS